MNKIKLENKRVGNHWVINEPTPAAIVCGGPQRASMRNLSSSANTSTAVDQLCDSIAFYVALASEV